MPVNSTSTDRIDTIVLKALEFLLASGGHIAGGKGLLSSILSSENGSSRVKKLESTLHIALGVTIDQWHAGYRDVTMRAFQRGLQTLLDDYYIASKLLEGDRVALNDPLLKAKLDDPARRNQILKVLGFDKEAISQIEKSSTLTTFKDPMNAILKSIDPKPSNKKDKMQRIEFMIDGALCYMPFAEPYDGQNFNIPVKAKDTQGNTFFHRSEMIVEKLNLSPGVGGAYHGLHLTPSKPTKQCARGLMIFSGTNPIGPLMATLHADTVPGISVGENFVNASADRLEKMYIARFKENIKTLLKDSDPNEVDYKKVWLEARTFCTGQSLGGSQSLQMLVKFPFMVEIAAFEPPFLLEKHRQEMEENLTNANVNFEKILNEIADSDPTYQEHITKFKSAIPKNANEYRNILKENNTVITQLFDPVTKYGTYSPPAQHYHVTTDKDSHKYNRVTDKFYKVAMAGTVMAHAMALSSQTDKKIVPLTKDIKNQARSVFTQLLHKIVWPPTNAVLQSYFYVKRAVQQKLFDTKDHPSKNPSYKDINEVILKTKIEAAISCFENSLPNIGKPDSWQNGALFLEKAQELDRMLKRAESANIVTDDFRLKITELTGDQKYKELLMREIDHSSNQSKTQTLNFNQQIQKYFEKYTDLLNKDITVKNKDDITQKLKTQRQRVVEVYGLMNKTQRKEFLQEVRVAIVKDNFLVTNTKNKLLKNLQDHAQSFNEYRTLQTLIDKQDKKLKIAQKEISRSINPSLSKFQKRIQLNPATKVVKPSSSNVEPAPHKNISSKKRLR